jgi:hypothetical protein
MSTLWVTSDLHSDLEKIAEAAKNNSDAWLDLGDEHDKILENPPFYEHTEFASQHPSIQKVIELVDAIEQIESEYQQQTEELDEKMQALMKDPEKKNHVTSFVRDFLEYAAKERKKLDDAFSAYKNPKYRILGNHDPALKSGQVGLIHNTVQDICGINVAGTTANGELSLVPNIVLKFYPQLYAHLTDCVFIEQDSDLEKITADQLRSHSPAFKALEGKDFDVLALHAPIFEKYAYNEHDKRKIYDAAMAKLVKTAKKKPQIVVWGHDHNEYSSLWKKDGIIYACVGPHRQIGLKFDGGKKLQNIVVKPYNCAPKEFAA